MFGTKRPRNDPAEVGAADLGAPLPGTDAAESEAGGGGPPRSPTGGVLQ